MRRLGIVAVAALLAVSCSSTARPKLSAPAPTAGAATPAVPEATGVAPAPAASARANPAPAKRASSKVSIVQSAAGPVVALQPGGSVLIGVHYSENLDAAYAALGAQRTSVDFIAVANAIKDHINRNGGMGGRRLEIDLWGSDPLRDDFDVLAQQACEHFTQDKKVFAVVSGAVLPSMVTPKCFADRRTPLAWEYYIPMDEQAFTPYMPFLYQPFSVVGKRLGIFVDGLAEIGYFDPGAKIGLVRYDTDIHKRITDNVLKPRLAARGLSIADEQAIKSPPNARSAGEAAAQVSSAVLSFKRNGITHVLFVPTGGAVPFVWMQAAQSQGFQARYGLTSLDYPYFVQGQAPAGTLSRAMGVGWMPANDVAPPQAPPDHPTEECFRITNTRVNDVARFCDGLFFLKAVFDRGGITTQADVQRVAESLAESFRSHWTFRTKLAAGRHDGAAAWRPFGFDDACRCFRYIDASLRPLPS
jgi:hypothetical protein